MYDIRGATEGAWVEAQKRLAAVADRVDFFLYRHTASWRPWQVALVSLLAAWLLAKLLATVAQQWGLFREKGEGRHQPWACIHAGAGPPNLCHDLVTIHL